MPINTPFAPSKTQDEAVDEVVDTTTDAKTDDEATPEKPKSTPAVKRDYEITKYETGTAEQLKAKIDEAFKDGAKGSIYIVFGTTKNINPKPALKNFGEKEGHDLKGVYKVFSSKNVWTSPDVGTDVETKRKVQGL